MRHPWISASDERDLQRDGAGTHRGSAAQFAEVRYRVHTNNVWDDCYTCGLPSTA